MEFISKETINELSNPGVISKQLLCPKNSDSVRVTITEVRLDSGASQPRHIHENSEQIWYAIKGKGLLLLDNDAEKEITAGEVVRFSEGDTHGLLNNSDDEFVYISVTAPPIDFSIAYRNKK